MLLSSNEMIKSTEVKVKLIRMGRRKRVLAKTIRISGLTSLFSCQNRKPSVRTMRTNYARQMLRPFGDLKNLEIGIISILLP